MLCWKSKSRPPPSLQQRQEIDELVKRSGALRKQSQELEKRRLPLVERAIEEGGR